LMFLNNTTVNSVGNIRGFINLFGNFGVVVEELTNIHF